MSAPAVIRGTLSNMQPVKTRGVWQLQIEVPIEDAMLAIEAFGIPVPGKEKWVAVALLDAKAAAAPQPPAPAEPEKPKRRFQDLPRSQQAGIRCGETEFVQWLDRRFHTMFAQCGNNEEEFVRRYCGVTSRSLLDAKGGPAESWDELNAQFLQDIGRMARDPRDTAA